RYSHLNAPADTLHPTLGFVDQLTMKNGDAVCDYRGRHRLESCQIVSKMIPRLKQDSMDRKMMGELHAHIGDKQTRCYECHTVTGTREEYYKHLRTHANLDNSNAMDLITLVVNVYQKE
ncbi:hypothetical protein PENTCL1PPCAC_10297, partial [Pristionchus entomophagus]